jgi:hypothetical protein
MLASLAAGSVHPSHLGVFPVWERVTRSVMAVAGRDGGRCDAQFRGNAQSDAGQTLREAGRTETKARTNGYDANDMRQDDALRLIQELLQSSVGFLELFVDDTRQIFFNVVGPLPANLRDGNAPHRAPL